MSEQLLQQLIHMVAENNRLVKETQEELREFKKEMYDFRDEMYEFRDDATRRLDRLERQKNISMQTLICCIGKSAITNGRSTG
ncbi:hypothetical protein [Brevibacillus porteri]|uniref:hypothetical protein n=1 Tax=Brevibacillus porteri TaxID=2126350 RepID=UPI003D1FDA5F